ncbi:MAG: hypothetical protein ACFFCZ_28115 [Promethearchaeota archaeon]
MIGRKMSYIICLVIFVALFALYAILLTLLEVPPGIGPEGYYLTPGGVTVEDLFVLVMLVIGSVVTGLIAIFFTKFYLKAYIRFLGEKKQIGMVKTEDPEGIKRLVHLFARALILGFFTGNICYTLASQEFIVKAMHEPWPDELANVIIPDLTTMLHLIWIIVIPCTIIFVPIVLMMDVGIVSTSKVKGIDFLTANQPTSNVYRLLRGYAGIGFIYNLIVTIYAFIVELSQKPEFLYDAILVVAIPPLLISFMFPLIVLLDYQKERFRESALAIMKDLNWNKQFIAEYSVKALGDLEKL